VLVTYSYLAAEVVENIRIRGIVLPVAKSERICGKYKHNNLGAKRKKEESIQFQNM